MNMNMNINTSAASCSSYPSSIIPLKFQRFSPFRAKPITLSCTKARLCFSQRSKALKGRKSFVLEAKNMAITEVDSHIEEDKEEGTSSSSSLVDSENHRNSRPRRIVLFVEPSPFA